MAAIPLAGSGNPAETGAVRSTFGEHTHEVPARLGIADETIDRLAASGVINVSA
jgi:crotonobetainyl-CoA:carnitine CoA-transferase CaiB-like acyl-CoA transferase